VSGEDKKKELGKKFTLRRRKSSDGTYQKSIFTKVELIEGETEVVVESSSNELSSEKSEEQESEPYSVVKSLSPPKLQQFVDIVATQKKTIIVSDTDNEKRLEAEQNLFYTTDASTSTEEETVITKTKEKVLPTIQEEL
jgi:hypothetical protein